MLVYKDLLKEFISFKSVSTDSHFQPEISKLVSWLQNLFQTHGFNVEAVTGYENPIIVAHYEKDPKLDTCLIYGHYDVQPASIEEGWFEDPFTLFEKDDRYYGRGVVDNKGQVLVHIYNILKLIEENNLGYNVKFVLEGNEETSSDKLPDFLKDNKELLKADFSLTSDGELTFGHPSIELGYRGIFNATITVKTSGKDLHSGLYGSTVPSATRELVELLAKLVDKDNLITIPGFYDAVKPMTAEEKIMTEKMIFDLDEFKTITGVKTLKTEAGYNQYAQNVFRPSFEITGLSGGYVGEGYRNAIPGHATAKVSFRLTAAQDPEKCSKQFTEHLATLVPDYVELTVVAEHMNKGVLLDHRNKYVEKAAKILEKSYKKEVLYKHCGAIVPVVVIIDELLNIPQAVVPLCNEDCNMHAANENLDISVLNMALEFSRDFFKLS